MLIYLERFIPFHSVGSESAKVHNGSGREWGGGGGGRKNTTLSFLSTCIDQWLHHHFAFFPSQTPLTLSCFYPQTEPVGKTWLSHVRCVGVGRGLRIIMCFLNNDLTFRETLTTCINPFPNKPWFLHVCSTILLKTLWEKEKLLVTSNFSFSHSVFFPLWELSAIFIKFEIVVCKPFQFGSV